MAPALHVAAKSGVNESCVDVLIMILHAVHYLWGKCRKNMERRNASDSKGAFPLRRFGPWFSTVRYVPPNLD